MTQENHLTEEEGWWLADEYWIRGESCRNEPDRPDIKKIVWAAYARARALKGMDIEVPIFPAFGAVEPIGWARMDARYALEIADKAYFLAPEIIADRHEDGSATYTLESLAMTLHPSRVEFDAFHHHCSN